MDVERRTDFFSLLSSLSLTPPFVFSNLSLSLPKLKLTCAQLTTRNSGARVESQQGNPLTGQSEPREQSRHTSWMTKTEARGQGSSRTRREKGRGS
jgi:hypothetical protein